MDDPHHYRIEELLENAGWTRGLAGALVRDDAEADDVAQETWRAALESPPGRERPARPWLATVARNFARRTRRTETRRRNREARAARPEAAGVPGPDELAAKLETQRALATLVADLREPFRSTVLLRFWEGLSSAEISRRTGVPAGTVRWRLKKALDDLRDRLDRRHGGRAAWLALLLPIMDPPTGPATGAGAAAAALGGAFLVKKTILVVLAVLLLGATLYVSGALGTGPAEPEPSRPDLARLEPATGTAAPATGTPDHPVVPTPPPSPPEPDRGAVRMRFVDGEGRPLRGVELRWDSRPEHPASVSGPDGIVRGDYPLGGSPETVRLVVGGPGLANRTIRVAARRGEVSDMGDVALERGGSLFGVVLGPDGRPDGGARVSLEKPERPQDVFVPNRLSGPLAAPHRTRADRDGRFRFDGIAEGTWRVWAGRRGMRWSASEPVRVGPDESAEEVRLRIEPLAATESVRGVVLDPDGKAVPGAEVSYRIRWTKNESDERRYADDQGRFLILLTPDTVSLDLVARDRQQLLGEARVDGYRPGDGELTFRLRHIPATAVLAVDEEGDPVAHFRVELLEPGSERRLLTKAGRDGRVELVPPPEPWRLRVEAEEHEPKELGPFAGRRSGEEIEVVLSRLPGIRGRVAAGGRPVGGARVIIHRMADPRSHFRRNGFTCRVVPTPVGEGVSGTDGTFQFAPRYGGRHLVRVEAQGYAPTESEPFDYDPAKGVTGVEVTPRKGGAIEGRVTAAEGDAAGTIVAISRGDGYATTKRVGANGVFRFENLTPGPWLVKITDEEIQTSFGSSSSSPGPSPRIPWNAEVRPGDATTVDLVVENRKAGLTGRISVDGRGPKAWKAGLYAPNGGLLARVETDVKADGTFRLRGAEGTHRLILASPGTTHEAVLVVAQVELVGEVRWSCSYETGALDWTRPEDAEAETVFYHRRALEDGTLVLTPVPEGESVRAPIGPGEIVRFDISIWSRPARWPTVAQVEVR